MHPTRIAELLEPYLAPCHSQNQDDPCHSEPGRSRGEESATLSPTQLQNISTYIDLLQHWNARINLTGIRNEEEIVTRHFGESLFTARHLFPQVKTNKGEGLDFSRATTTRQDWALAPEGSDIADHQPPTTNHRVADLGSGPGFPGIPIKLWAPQIALTLIESSQKKSAFLREVARALTLTNIDIQTARAETLSETYDTVTLRAVEHFTQILPTAARLAAPLGRLALLISAEQIDKAHTQLPSFEWQSPLPIPNSQTRVLLVGSRK